MITVNKFGRTPEEQIEFATNVGKKIYINICNKKMIAKIGGINENFALMCVSLLDAMRNATEQDMTIEGIIAENLRPFPKESFFRWADRNNVSDVSPSYFSKEGIAIDVQAQGMIQDFHLFLEESEVIQEIVNFVCTYRKGTYKSYWQLELQNLTNDFITMVGFEPKDYYLEHIILQYFSNGKTEINTTDFELTQNDECPF
jgi:hypothetical protein